MAMRTLLLNGIRIRHLEELKVEKKGRNISNSTERKFIGKHELGSKDEN